MVEAFVFETMIANDDSESMTASRSVNLRNKLREVEHFLSVHDHGMPRSYKEWVQSSKVKALLYRLSGDYNPLHSDSTVAAMAGFNRPILHGLCTLGFAIRAIIRSVCNGNPTVVRSIFARFLLHVFPGETLITEIWIEGPKIIYQTKVKERNKVVLLGCVMLNHIGSSL
ncbi:hypothetical protein HPP92_013944 [Vanilla planifolia]|uniref:MaoC-like domain-containing protein n=1 Tax=Vanilla planifolia TaxID=51239 RepID=A0A835QTG3_VANPL|nr:hypothetical protein HPP92_013944 [Vanilla planifolia]